MNCNCVKKREFLIIKVLFFISVITVNGQVCEYDKGLAEKFGLAIPVPVDHTKPAPEWLQNTDMITRNANIWKNYQFTLKDTLMTRIVRRREAYSPVKITEYYPVESIDSLDGFIIKGVSLIIEAPHNKKAFEEAHKQGFKIIPYLHFWDIHTNYSDQDVFYFEHPEILLKDRDGKWSQIPMDGTARLHRFHTCANNPSYWKLSLDYVKKIMDWGADGIFIDNLQKREPCIAPEFTTKNPEFPPYIHEHLFPNATHDYAWSRMLQSIYELVKSYGEDKIVIINKGSLYKRPVNQADKYCDAYTWESFVHTWSLTGRLNTWEEVKKFVRDKAVLMESGKKIVAFSYLRRNSESCKDDAFWAFSAARLVDFIWWATEALDGSGGEILYQVHMGKGLGPFKEINGIAYRVFEKGVIVLNGSMEDQNIELTLPAGFTGNHLQDLYMDSMIVNLRDKKIKISIPMISARVYLVKQ